MSSFTGPGLSPGAFTNRLTMEIKAFRELIWEFYREHARDGLPWRQNITPYGVFISEIMLQQTQVARVIQKYGDWTRELPSFEALASASTEQVLTQWQGLGYNRRALWTKHAAEIICNDYKGVLPASPQVLRELPGIGPNTAGSLAVFAYDVPVVFIETNIRRVMIHHFFPESEYSERLVSDRELMPLIESTLDHDSPRQWYYALMDYGSTLIRHVPNPNRRSTQYVRQSQFEGSLRQLRGEVIRRLLVMPQTLGELQAGQGRYSLDDPRLPAVLTALVAEGFASIKEGSYKIV